MSRASFIRDAIALARAGAPLAAICRLSNAASRIKQLTKAEATRIVLARRVGQPRRNPDRPRILWFLVAGQHWITATARGSESVGDALSRSYLAGTGFARTNLQVTKPDGFTPGEWLGTIAKHAVYKPQHTNPPRDPIYVGAFRRGFEPKKSKEFVDGDTAAVESPYRTRLVLDAPYEVWVYGTIDPRQGDNWNYVSGPASRSDAVEEAKRLAKF